MKRRLNFNKFIRYSDQTLDVNEIGGKLAKQQKMISQGLNVPKFFCITKHLYREVLKRTNGEVSRILSGIEFNRPDSVEAAAKKIKGLFSEVELKNSEIKSIGKAFDRYFARDQYVAVRSSTVGHKLEESEDSASNPFAGMSETFLFVKREQIIPRVLECFASGFCAESILYRHAQNMDLMGFEVAVAVQEMVTAQKSFVLFTANPIKANLDPVIVAGYGSGEGVVQEKVPVDHYFIGKKTKDIRKEIAKKTLKMEMNREVGHGLKMTEVDGPDQSSACLDDQTILKIVDSGETIAHLFGGPQDIEGCLDHRGEIYFLQSRPICYDYQKMRLWTNANVTESFPGVTTALTYSLSRHFYSVIFEDCYRRIGISNKRLRDNQKSLDSMIGFLEGRIYYNLSSFYHLHSQVPLFPVFRSHWEKMMGFRSSYHTEQQRSFQQVLSKVAETGRVSRAAFDAVYQFARHEHAMKEFHSWWDGLIKQVYDTDCEKKDPLVLSTEFVRVWREVGTHWGITLINDSYLPLLYGLTEKIFQKWLPKKDEALLSDLLCGDEELLSVEIVLSAVRLSEYVRNHPEVLELFQKHSANELAALLEQRELPKEFGQKVEKHLKSYGDRGLQELKIEQPNTRHAPESLMQAIKNYIRIQASEKMMKEKEAAVRESGERRLKAALQGKPVKYLFVQLILHNLRKLIRYRENSRYCRSQLFGYSKDVFRGIGKQFVKAGILDSWEDIYHLNMEEIFGLIDGTGVTNNLRALAAIRKEEYKSRSKTETPIEITTYGPIYANQAFKSEEQECDGKTLKGLGSSSGRVRGRARVVLDPTTVSQIDDDTILVAKETDPGWMFLMLASKGIVVECGSMLSHTAITGRKFGIPTIVSVPMAMKRIPDGALLEIDGSTGEVTIIEDMQVAS